MLLWTREFKIDRRRPPANKALGISTFPSLRRVLPCINIEDHGLEGAYPARVMLSGINAARQLPVLRQPRRAGPVYNADRNVVVVDKELRIGKFIASTGHYGQRYTRMRVMRMKGIPSASTSTSRMVGTGMVVLAETY